MAQSAAAWSCLALLFACWALPAAQAEYPGVIELVGYSNRRARTQFLPSEALGAAETPTLAPPVSKMRADIETVRRNMKKYERLLELDTKNLPEPQKDMLARIVERVARLKASLDNEEQLLSRQEASSSTRSSITQLASEEASTMMPTQQMEAETDPTLLLDETTLLELQHTMNEQAAMQAAVTAQTTLMQDPSPTTTDISYETPSGDSTNEPANAETAETAQTAAVPPSTTISDSLETEPAASSEEQTVGSTTSDDELTDATDADDQFVAARSNNNIAAITAADDDSSSATTSAGNQRTLTTMGKLKNRVTKRPFAHKAAVIKRGQRPSTAAAAAGHKPNTASTQKQKLSTSTAGGSSSSVTSTNNAHYQKLQTKPLHKVTASMPGSQTLSTVAAITTTNTAAAAPALPLEQLYTRTPQANIPVAIAAAAAAASAGASSSAASPATTYSSNGGQHDSMVYDGHVNTSAIIDSLSTNAREEYYQQKQTVNNKDNKKTATAKPTKYHYYPHNQHIYLLPECAIQQVCNAVYVRLNYTQPLCACPSRYRDPCSASLNEDDQHTTKLVGDNKKKAITLAKTCEATTEMRECRSPKDWSLLALQNTRTGKSHYLVICRCPDHFKMEGPMAHDQPTYASVPGIRVFGMMCVKPGYSLRKPSAQPPKRYQLQKPFYRPASQSSYVGAAGGAGSNVGLSSGILNSNAPYGGVQKDSYGRPIFGAGSSSSSSGGSPISANYQPQDQSFQSGSNYQYLNRPESVHTHSAGNFRPDQFSLNNFPGSNYGRNNERRGESPIEAANADDAAVSSSTQASEEARTTLQSEQQEAAAAASSNAATSTESQISALEQSESRSKRSLVVEAEDYEPDAPEFPWDRVAEFQQTIVWD